MAKDMECYRAEYVNCKGTKFGTAHDGLEDAIYFPFHFLFFLFLFLFSLALVRQARLLLSTTYCTGRESSASLRCVCLNHTSIDDLRLSSLYCSRVYDTCVLGTYPTYKRHSPPVSNGHAPSYVPIFSKSRRHLLWHSRRPSIDREEKHITTLPRPRDRRQATYARRTPHRQRHRRRAGEQLDKREGGEGPRGQHSTAHTYLHSTVQHQCRQERSMTTP